MNELERQLKFDFRTVPLELLSPDDIYRLANVELFERLKEDRRLERKPAGVHSRALGDYISMWANTPSEGGLIAIGIENNGTVSGCSSTSQDHMNDLERAGDIYCPDARFESKRVPARRTDGGDDYVLLCRVLYRSVGRVARTVAGDAFIRIGESKRKLSEEQIREIEIDRGAVEFEREPCGMVFPGDFDIELVIKFASNFLARRGLSGHHSVLDVLTLAHLGTIENLKFVPNNACALLFAKDPRSIFPGCKMRFLRFDGEEERTGAKWNAVKDEWVDIGPIPRQLAAIEKILDAQIREFSSLGNDGIFYTAPEYPKEAWYEAIVNGNVHRSYSQRNMSMFVKMFDDRLVIESPGGFPPLVTSENIYDMHQPRNPRLMEAMFFLDFVKCAHEGTRRIRDSMVGMKLPMPRFEQKEINAGLVRVTLQNDIKHRKVWVDKEASEVVGEVLAGLLTDHERRVINFVAEHHKISVSQAQRLIGKSWPSASRLLKGLKQKGILDDVRSSALKERDPGARYILKKVTQEKLRPNGKTNK